MELKLHNLEDLKIDENIDWIEYYKYNKAHLLKLDFGDSTITEEEKLLITPSIRAFQLGEGSDGKRLLAAVGRNKIIGNDILEATPYFISEENRHSSTLKIFMDHEGIIQSKGNKLDSVFRFLRSRIGLQCQVNVLVTAEMIALSYYTVLSSATKSDLLKTICTQMLQDELTHIVYQSRILRTLSTPRNKFSNILINISRKILMNITLIVVYNSYKNIFKEVGCSYKELRKTSLGYLKQSMEIVSPKSS